MTTDLDRLAVRSTRHGYFHPIDSHEAWVPCPLCRERVRTTIQSGVRTQFHVTAALQAAVRGHLDDCQDGAA